ncbi:MAG TPA: glycine zipper family protein [Nitrosomonas sp.]|nr:glycine zipper family protein [Nitrosomonas sp.]
MFKISKSRLLSLPLLTAILAACVSLPTGPSVMVLPGSSKNFEQFRHDDYDCRRYAYQQVGGTTPKNASISSGVESAAVGTGLGAAAGAAFGGGEGAAIGAGAGLLAGSLAGSSASRTSGYESQYRYDVSYIQCMYAKGHRVPVSGRITSDDQTTTNQKPARILPSSPGFTPPPPPPGNPPPAPPQ